ncbi:MAG: hypothetical protein JSS02_03375 [Planctomycetes bacterium]|nr:hypothetical protein [Planctomycetota bacterium]
MHADTTHSQPAHRRRVPLWLKGAYTLFIAILVPHYWQTYGPTNFLFFCDVAAFFTLAAVWLERPLLASMPAIGILLPQALWIIDFLLALCGFRMTGMTDYMFDSSIPLFSRGLSLFHFWLPILLVWLNWRLGYDQRALRAWTVLAWGLVAFCYLCMPAPPAPPEDPQRVVNINYVYGLSDKQPQQWLPQPLYVLAEMAVLALLIFWPTHALLSRLFPLATHDEPTRTIV